MSMKRQRVKLKIVLTLTKIKTAFQNKRWKFKPHNLTLSYEIYENQDSISKDLLSIKWGLRIIKRTKLFKNKLSIYVDKSLNSQEWQNSWVWRSGFRWLMWVDSWRALLNAWKQQLPGKNAKIPFVLLELIHP